MEVCACARASVSAHGGDPRLGDGRGARHRERERETETETNESRAPNYADMNAEPKVPERGSAESGGGRGWMDGWMGRAAAGDTEHTDGCRHHPNRTPTSPRLDCKEGRA